jgi:hypothetical protein
MLKIILNQEGLSGFYKGLIPSLFLTINPIIQYVIYEFLKERVSKDGFISSASIIWTSALSKLITTLFTYPILSVKTLIQANEKKNPFEVLELLGKMIQEKGPLYLYKGNFLNF